MALVKEAATTHGGAEEGVLKATKMGVEVTLPFESAPEVVGSSPRPRRALVA